MPDYKKMYLKLLGAAEQTMNILIAAQQGVRGTVHKPVGTAAHGAGRIQTKNPERK